MPTRPISILRIVATLVGFLVTSATLPAVASDDLGVGVAQPTSLDPATPLYFYFTAPADDPTATAPDDSLTLRFGEYSLEIASAPPWFAPETVKLDYDILLFRAQRLTRHWVEVVVNDSPDRPRSHPRTAWMSREAVRFLPWTEFLLEVFSIEPLEPASNPVRSGPGESFPVVVPSEGLGFRVIAVEGSWAQVEDADADETGAARGWIRWRDGDRLVVLYALLS